MLEICPFLVKYSAKCLYRLLTEKSLYINVFSNLLQNLIKFLIFLSRQQLKKSI